MPAHGCAPHRGIFDGVVKYLEAHVNYPRWIPGVYPSVASVAAMISSGSKYICVEESEGRIAAAFAMNAEAQGDFWKGRWSRDLADGEFAVIHALAIDPAMQRQGLGSRIIRFCVEQANAQGYRAIRVDIVPGNLPARALFEKNGFIWIGDVDLEMGIEGIPVFSLYELNW